MPTPSYPSNVATVTVTGTWVYSDGSGPATGIVTFAPNVILADGTSVPPDIVLPKPLTVTLVNGTISVELMATDDTHLLPAGWAYRITEKIAGQSDRTYYMQLPAAQPTVDLATVAPLASAPALVQYASAFRKITAGTGLTGGGDLTADRTLAVAYGTTAGTAAQGNDSRIVGAAQRSTLAINVKDYGAVGDGVTDDTSAVQAALAAVQSANGGLVYFPRGTYLVNSTLVMWWNARWRGDGVGATVIKLANGANCDLVQTYGFQTNTGGTAQAGPNHWSIRDLTLDGNGANQTGTSWTMRVYGSCYQASSIEIINGHSGNVWSEWGTGGTDMEAQWSDFKIMNSVAGPNVVWNGPHDSQFQNGQVIRVSATNGVFNGIHTQGNAGGEQFTNVHIWGTGHDIGWNCERAVITYGGEAEGATTCNVLLLASRSIWCGEVYGTANANSPTEVGVQIGDATHQVSNYLIQVMSWQWTAAGHVPFVFSNDKGGILDAVCQQGSATNMTTGTIHARSRVQIISADPGGTGTGVLMPFSVFLPSNRAIRVSDGTQDKFAVGSNITPGVVQYPNGTKATGYSDAYTTSTWRLDSTTGAVQPGTAAGLGGSVFSGRGAPTIAGTAGDYYLRIDTPGTVNQRLYVCTGGTSWTGIL